MNSPIISSAIQQKFLKLLQEINTFFAGERQLLDKDRSQLSLARACALELTLETASAPFDRFLTYLLGSTEINSDYPLQAVRMVCVTAKALQGEKISPEQRQETLSAALVSDTGFRPAWLGHHGSHFEITAYQLKGLSLPWYTPGLERMILNHHSPEDDPSPLRILSLVSRYLGMVYGTGIEDIGQALVSPAKTMEALMTEFHPETTGLRLLLKALSAFPLGSWVQLNTGQAGLITGAGARNPLRPKVSMYRDPSKSVNRWEEIELDKKPTVYITGSLLPTPPQLSLLNFPEILVPGWVPHATASGALRTPPSAESVNATESTMTEANTLPSNLKTMEDYRQYVRQKNRPETSANPVEPDPANAGHRGWKATDLSDESFGSKHRLLKFYREELVKLRTTWEQQVRAAEQVSASLKSPLIESYRRENELMSAMIERLEAIGTDVAESPHVPEDASPEEPAATAEPQALPEPASPFKLSDRPAQGLSQAQDHLLTFQARVQEDQTELEELKGRFREALHFLESREFKTLPSLMAFVRQWQAKLQSMQDQLDQTDRQASSLTMEWNILQDTLKTLAKDPKEELSRSWKEDLQPRMEKVLGAASQALLAHHQRLMVHKDMIERFCAEAYQLAV